ncbi:MAG: Na+/H+ antiporter subunit C [Gemmatimonadales bacterium]|nr:MAG: Na+/H+ antiporter subunit C [Gemmatimonadales bacterium]
MLAGIAITLIALYAALTRAHLFWKVLAINLMGTGIFLILLAAPSRRTPEIADPLPQAMVLTGIVVAVAATALALGIALRVIARSDLPFLPDGDEDDPDSPGSTGEASR